MHRKNLWQLCYGINMELKYHDDYSFNIDMGLKIWGQKVLSRPSSSLVLITERLMMIRIGNLIGDIK